MQKICFVGLGYIGLPTAALVASKGIPVHGVDIKQDVVDTINKGEIHIVEPDLEGLVKYDVERGYLKASTKPVVADVFVIAVPTPFKKSEDFLNNEQLKMKNEQLKMKNEELLETGDRQRTNDQCPTTNDRSSNSKLSIVNSKLNETSHIAHRTSHSGSIPEPDISYVESAVKAIIPFLKDGDLVIIESTSPIGTTEKMYKLIMDELVHFNEQLKMNNEELIKSPESRVPSRESEDNELKDCHSCEDRNPEGSTTNNKQQTTDHKNSIPRIFMAYCPERVLPGQVIHELEHNDRVVGGIDKESVEKACDFYKLFVKGELHKTNSRTAEMCKLTENAYRDVNIAFANELSMICDKAEIDVYELIKMTNKHPRVNVLTPGCGVGGHCIAVDPWFIVSQFPKESLLIHTARNTNDYKPEFVIQKIEQAAEEWKRKHSGSRVASRGLGVNDSKELTSHNSQLTSHTGSEDSPEPVIACLGLAFKPNIDDLRESPALFITEELIRKGYNIMPVEPNIKKDIELKFNIYELDEALYKADILVKLVNHRQFKNIICNLRFC